MPNAQFFEIAILVGIMWFLLTVLMGGGHFREMGVAGTARFAGLIGGALVAALTVTVSLLFFCMWTSTLVPLAFEHRMAMVAGELLVVLAVIAYLSNPPRFRRQVR